MSIKRTLLIGTALTLVLYSHTSGVYAQTVSSSGVVDETPVEADTTTSTSSSGGSTSSTSGSTSSGGPTTSSGTTSSGTTSNEVDANATEVAAADAATDTTATDTTATDTTSSGIGGGTSGGIGSIRRNGSSGGSNIPDVDKKPENFRGVNIEGKKTAPGSNYKVTVQANSNNHVEGVQTRNPDGGLVASTIGINVSGKNNTIDSSVESRRGFAYASDGGTLKIDQKGDNNEILLPIMQGININNTLSQINNDNKLTLKEQNGTDLTINTRQRGGTVITINSQTGEKNTIDAFQGGASRVGTTTATFDQRGSENTIKTDQRGSNKELIIHQDGDKNEAYLKQSPGAFNSKATITQSNGSSGGTTAATGNKVGENATSSGGFVPVEQAGQKQELSITQKDNYNVVKGLKQASTAVGAKIEITQGGYTQTDDPAAGAGANQVNKLEQTGKGAKAKIAQTYDAATASSSGGSSGGTFAPNKIELLQNGENASANLAQTGLGNEIMLTQDGKGSATATTTTSSGGTSTEDVMVTQTGKTNKATLTQQTTSEGSTANLIQKGNNNQITADQAGKTQKLIINQEDNFNIVTGVKQAATAEGASATITQKGYKEATEIAGGANQVNKLEQTGKGAKVKIAQTFQYMQASGGVTGATPSQPVPGLTPNKVEVTQSGENVSADLAQTGLGNEILLIQDGAGAAATTTSSGGAASGTVITQTGEFNKASLNQLKTSSGASANLVQEGSFNSINVQQAGKTQKLTINQKDNYNLVQNSTQIPSQGEKADNATAEITQSGYTGIIAPTSGYVNRVDQLEQTGVGARLKIEQTYKEVPTGGNVGNAGVLPNIIEVQQAGENASAHIIQTGSGNKATLKQLGKSKASTSEFAVLINQDGVGNNIDLTQTETAVNATADLSQIGDNNLIKLLQEAPGASAIIAQNGDKNFVDATQEAAANRAILNITQTSAGKLPTGAGAYANSATVKQESPDGSITLVQNYDLSNSKLTGGNIADISQLGNTAGSKITLTQDVGGNTATIKQDDSTNSEITVTQSGGQSCTGTCLPVTTQPIR